MHKISNFTGSARHALTPSNIGFGSGPRQPDMHPNAVMPGHGHMPHQAQMKAMGRDHAAMGRNAAANMPRGPLSLSFNVPFNSNLAGPEPDDVIHATPGAFARWTHPEGTIEPQPNHKLPVHVSNVENLRALCKHATESSGGAIQATVTTGEPKLIPGLQLGSLRSMVTNVCVTGGEEDVKKMRARILSGSPISLRCATVDLDQNLVADSTATAIRTSVLEHMTFVAQWTGTDIFLLKPKVIDNDTAVFQTTLDNTLDQRYRVAIFGDIESAEHAKTRILIMIDQILKRKVDVFKLELSLHTMVFGRLRRHLKQIEAQTNTAIYFPPPFPQIYGYIPPGANRRREDEIFLTGNSEQDTYRAKAKIHDLVRTAQACQKVVKISADKVDSILLERLDKIRKIMEFNSSYVLFSQLGVQRGEIRVQGSDMLHVERTVREVMAISGQFYSASWLVATPEHTKPDIVDIQRMLADICTSSGAEVKFGLEGPQSSVFQVYGSDDSVKAALWIISTLPFVKKSQSHLRVKIELANEHKEFVSGKKNGKINKIMSQSNVQVYFDLFNEYNFFIDVSGHTYEATKSGLDLVEQEMPASIAFHVPDQYHKRIIGIGGQHIQRIMKKYSVFVKFSNAMDRGGVSKEDDDIKVDNVICRTPARNAQNLDLVKQEIMDMVEKADAEFVSEHVMVNRLYHRELLARLPELEEIEKKFNCKITFPSTEDASDTVTVTGPEYQVPQAVDAFLGMVPERHEITFTPNDELSKYFDTHDFAAEVIGKLRSQHEIELHVNGVAPHATGIEGKAEPMASLTLCYTRNNAGGLKDAIDLLTAQLVAHGLDASTVRGGIPRPKSDSFEDSLPFFDSKLLHTAQPTDSPTRPGFGTDGVAERSFFDKLRKPGSIGSFSSFLSGRRHFGSSSRSAASSSFMKHASANASRASLVSLESQNSSYRNPWNDSGVNLADDDGGWPAQFSAPAAGRLPYAGHPGAAASSASLAGSFSALPPPGSSHSQHNGANNGFGFPMTLSGLGVGDMTPKSLHDQRESHDSGRPSTRESGSHFFHNGELTSGSNTAASGSSSSGASNPGPIGPPTSK